MLPADDHQPDREIIMTRVLDAPRSLVWKVWTQLEHLSNWWGPRGFTTTTEKRECVPGGVWKYVMHGPDGTDYQNLMTFLEVVEHERLSYKQGGAGDTEPINFQVTVTFADEGDALDKTKLVMRLVFPSKQAKDYVVNTYNAIEGGKQTMERLAEHIQSLKQGGGPSDIPFVTTRVFRAPHDLVWKAWTESEHLRHWFGPKDSQITHCEVDLRVGGKFLYCMQSADGSEMWARWVYRQINPQTKIESIHSFSDATGDLKPVPFEGAWPVEILSLVTFAEHAGLGKGVVVRVEWTPFNATESERKFFATMHTSMQQGWGGSFDQLEGYLAGK
jgi:uncharacterized protein YndB with AHSA1/START domain